VILRYLLDTNAVIALLSGPDHPVSRRARAHSPTEVGLSSISLHELYYGAFRSQRVEHNLTRVEGLLLEVVDFDGLDGRESGSIRAELGRRGTPIGPCDVLIAGQARARRLTLVTANVREFERVDGLSVEDWSDVLDDSD
jgi:tRNA(fMet)-specific endonuclease VapC